MRRALEKMEGIDRCCLETTKSYLLTGISKIDISLEQQLVVVEGEAKPEEVLEKIRKTGKAATLV